MGRPLQEQGPRPQVRKPRPKAANDNTRGGVTGKARIGTPANDTHKITRAIVKKAIRKTLPNVVRRNPAIRALDALDIATNVAETLIIGVHPDDTGYPAALDGFPNSNYRWWWRHGPNSYAGYTGYKRWAQTIYKQTGNYGPETGKIGGQAIAFLKVLPIGSNPSGLQTHWDEIGIWQRLTDTSGNHAQINAFQRLGVNDPVWQGANNQSGEDLRPLNKPNWYANYPPVPIAAPAIDPNVVRVSPGQAPETAPRETPLIRPNTPPVV